MEAMASSAGTLDSSYAKYLDSATAHLNRFKAQFQDLSQNVVQSYLIGNIADVGTGILWVVNQIAQLVDKLGGLKTAILAIITTVSALKALDTARSLETTRLKMQEMTAAIFDRRIAVDSLTSSIQAMNAQEKESLRTMIIKEAAARGVSDAERDQILAVAGLTASERVLETQGQKVAVGFKSIWSSMSLLGKISAVLSIASVVSSLLGLDEKVRNLFKTTEERIAETGNRLKELQDQANTTVNNFQRIRKSTEEIIPNFVKLAEGVDEFGRQGTLTNEEYAEFISLNNQLAELFPEINMGMDSNGNAMLMLDYKTQNLTDTLNGLVDAQRELANQKLVGNLEDQYEAAAEQVNNYNDKIYELQKRQEKLQKFKGLVGTYGLGADPVEVIQNLAGALGSDTSRFLVEKYGYDWDKILGSEEFKAAGDRLEGEIKVYGDKIGSIWNSAMPNLTAFMQSDSLYNELDPISQMIADAMLKGVDLSEYDSLKDIKGFIKNGIITPIYAAGDDVKLAFAYLLDLNSALEKGEIEYKDYVSRVRGIFQELFDGLEDGSDAENSLIEWLKLLGISGDSAADIIENLIVKFGGLPSAVEESNKELKKFTDLVGDLKSSYDLLAKAQKDMDDPEGNGGLTPDTLKALADAEEDYLKYLYEENGVIKLNTQAWKEYAETQINSDINSIEKRNAELRSSINAVRDYQNVLKEAAGIDLEKTVFGNIDTNNRGVINWTEAMVEQFRDAIESWDINPDDLLGSISTVLGGSEEFDGIEIAFSPILQTENGPVLLDSDTVHEYIYGLIDKAGDNWDSKILQLDTEGLEFDGQLIKGLLADIGATAIETGEAMHYVGKDGAVNSTLDALKAAADEAGVSVDDLIASVGDFSTELDSNEKLLKVYNTVLDSTHESVEKLADSFNSIQQGIQGFSNKSKGLESLSKMYEDVKNGGDFDFTAFIDDTFVKQFSQYTDAYQAFMNTIAESPDNIDACQEAFNNLATEYVYGSGLLDNLEDGNKKVIAAMLEHMGVANADAVVEAELARQKERVRLETIGVTKKTYDEIIALSQEKDMSLATRQALVELAQKKFEVNKNTIKTSADIQNLYDLAKAAGATTGSLEKIAKAKALMAEIAKYEKLANSSDSRTAHGAREMIYILTKQVEALMAQQVQYNNAPPAVYYTGGNSSYSGTSGSGSSGGGSSGSSGSSSSSSQKAETWFEKEYKTHNHLRKMEKETDKTYFTWLDAAYKKAYGQGIMSLDDYRKYQEEVFDGLRSLFKDHLNDVEHQIYLLELYDAQSRDINKIISIYKGLMKDVGNESSKARSQGLDESSEYIQELQKQYREYANAIEEARSNWFKELNEDWKFRIDDLTQHGADPNTIVNEYKAIAEKVQKEIQWYLSNGFKISDDVVQDLVRQLWEITDNIVSVANSAVDGIQNVYSTLTDAAKEWAQTGYLSVDSLQSILELGPKYLSFLYDENGQLKINEAAIQKVLAARTEELAVDNAMVYAKQLLAAAEHKDTEELKALTKVESSKTASTWDMVYATIALAEATGKANGVAASYFDDARDYVDKMRSLTNTTITTIAASYETLNSDYISQADALEAVIGYTKELIKFETTQHIDALKDEIEAYKKIVDAKKESLKLSKEQDKHDKDLAEKIEEIAQLQAKIDQLALDDSREARAQRAKLEEQLAEKQKALADSQNDYAYDKQVEALDKSYEAFESEKNAEIDTLENMYQSEEALYNAAIDRIANGWDDLYSQLIDWNTKYGSVLNDTITAAWEQAAAAVQRYGDILKAIEGVNSHEYIGPNSASIADSMKQNALSAATAVGEEQERLLENNRLLAEQYSAAYGHKVVYKNGTWVDSDTGKALYTISKDEQAQAIVNAMRKNGSLYGKSDSATQEYLSELNLILGERLEKLLGQRVYRKDGVWYIGNKKLFDVYHSGGIVGGNASKKQTEVLALLEKGEAVLDKKRETALYKVVDFVKYLSDKLGSAVNLSKLSPAPRHAGISSTSISDGISGIPISVGDAAVNTTVSVQINHSGPFKPEDADNFGRIIADSTIDKINSAFTKRGISSIGRAALKA